MPAEHVHAGETIDYIPGADVAVGDVIVQGDLVGVAQHAIAANELGALTVAGVFDILKAAVSIDAGAFVYWNSSTKRATTSTGVGINKYLGKAVKAAASGDATVRVRRGDIGPAAYAPTLITASYSSGDEQLTLDFDQPVVISAAPDPGDLVVRTGDENVDEWTLVSVTGARVVLAKADASTASGATGSLTWAGTAGVVQNPLSKDWAATDGNAVQITA